MIGADAIGRLAIAQEPAAGTVFVLNAATGLFTLTGEAAVFDVLMAAAQGSFALSGQATLATFQIIVSTGFFTLTGEAANASFSVIQQPLKVVQDQFDVDEWGRFYRGGGMRYTL